VGVQVAIAAAFMNICVCHLEGGEITGTIDESIRHSVTKLSHLHLVCTEDARNRVISMGEQADRSFSACYEKLPQPAAAAWVSDFFVPSNATSNADCAVCRVFNTGCPLHDEIRRLDLHEAPDVQKAWWQRHPTQRLENPPERSPALLLS
jgi:hypothetical protein